MYTSISAFGCFSGFNQTSKQWRPNCLVSTSRSQSIIGGSQDRNSSRVGTWRHELMQRPWMGAAYGLLLIAYSAAFLTKPRTTQWYLQPTEHNSLILHSTYWYLRVRYRLWVCNGPLLTSGEIWEEWQQHGNCPISIRGKGLAVYNLNHLNWLHMQTRAFAHMLGLKACTPHLAFFSYLT